ncbi:CocE/NonD family hydrolase [Steroidobacter sp.]|uniref:CocE/NonD family hydrolase n=1 Tax=Steroidobacter sp. TaxID=1978227 RepID=UPI001A3E8065|nr:CocE/NonD family hydrolase [Steroidobacter sp.]MBL8270816.1 CocE/NonD family hydrolase [Steroidobacter sp.]
MSLMKEWFGKIRVGAVLLSVAAVSQAQEVPSPPQASDAQKIKFEWSVKIPLRDGVRLNATLYTPKAQQAPAPCIFTVTPYVAQNYHDRGVYFAARGFPFLTIDVRGRGNSEGTFRPFLQEANDGYDVVEWLAKQPYCNGRVASWGGSYAGYDQWALAKELPPHLSTIVPVASVYPGLDFPMFANMPYPYMIQWLTYTSGRTSQDKLFADHEFWGAINREWFEAGRPLQELDTLVGNPSPIFQEWLQHPHRDAYWDAYVPTPAQYGRMQMPILTITGSHDSDQPGALMFYREHMRHATPEARARHYLIIGPWDHAGTRTPKAQFGGLTFGQASLVDLPQLHAQWYAWTMADGAKPEFLRAPVAYYVMGAEEWRYAQTLDAVTHSTQTLFLDSQVNASDVFASGALQPQAGRGKPDTYVYDPRDTSSAVIESAKTDLGGLVDQRLIYANSGRQLVYHSAPFVQDTEISGFFKFSAWLAIDRPDTDFSVSVYEIGQDGSSIALSSAQMRARYRRSAREPELIRTREPLRYDFDDFRFVSRRVAKGSRLRLVVEPMNSLNSQKNYNSGGVVALESMKDAQPVTVKLFHDATRPSSLAVPIGHPTTK